jgi:hypothetical protein
MPTPIDIQQLGAVTGGQTAEGFLKRELPLVQRELDRDHPLPGGRKHTRQDADREFQRRAKEWLKVDPDFNPRNQWEDRNDPVQTG